MSDAEQYTPRKKPKRFVAGVVCPKCSEMDSTVLYHDDNGDEVRECISCDFSQTSSEQAQEDQARQQQADQLASQLTTRVTPTGKAVLDEGEQPLKIIGLGSPAPRSDD